jgi:hypothetical protein
MLMSKNETSALAKRVDGVLNQIGNTFGNLRQRWQHESDYEPFADHKNYAKSMVEKLEDPGIVFHNWSKAGHLTVFVDGRKIKIRFLNRWIKWEVMR